MSPQKAKAIAKPFFGRMTKKEEKKTRNMVQRVASNLNINSNSIQIFIQFTSSTRGTQNRYKYNSPFRNRTVELNQTVTNSSGTKLK